MNTLTRIQANYEAIWHRYRLVGYDAYGNEQGGFYDEKFPILGAFPGRSLEIMGVTVTDGIQSDLTLIVDDVSKISARDEFTWKNERFQVQGLPADFTSNPFGYTPGGYIHLRRVTG